MYQLLLVGSMLGCLVTTTAVSQAATDATDATSDVSPTPSSQASTNSPGYEFAVPPATNSDVVYRVDRSTGEVGACVFSAKGPTIGSTICFLAGEGAGPQPAGDYGLIPSNSATASGLFRVNRNTGEMSVCYVFNERPLR
jgi:hypothetical protein